MHKDIIKINKLEQRIAQLRKCFEAHYENGMRLSSSDAVKLSFAIENKLDKLSVLEKKANR